jgi:hypothetical protein
MELINKSFIIHSAWNVATTNKIYLLTTTLKAKFYPESTFWTTPTTGFRSVYWSSLL